MEEIIGNFFDDFSDGFLEYLEAYKSKALSSRNDYKQINKNIEEIKRRYPNARTFIEEKEPIELRDDEQYAVLDILAEQEKLDIIELKETFKLGFKEALIYFKNMKMLNI